MRTTPAEPWDRFLANLVDGILYTIPYVMLYFTRGNYGIGPVGLLGGLLLLALLGVNIYLLSTEGQTLAKKFFNLRIVTDETGEPAGFVRVVILRYVLNGFLCYVPFYALVDALFIFREDHRCIHDHIAGTTVINSIMA